MRDNYDFSDGVKNPYFGKISGKHIITGIDTICKVLENARKGADFYLLIGDFLDEFYKAEQMTQQAMINEPPAGNALENKQEYLSFAAATTHKLANDYELSVPEWVFEKQHYYMQKPFFACNATGDLRLLFMYKSPSEFKHRNLFVDENVLGRV